MVNAKELAMITKGKNADVCNAISAELGWYVTPQDISSGYFGPYNEDPCYIEVMEVLKGGGIKLKMWHEVEKSCEINELDRVQLPGGGYIFAPKS